MKIISIDVIPNFVIYYPTISIKPNCEEEQQNKYDYNSGVERK
jgi:hypothetical protein